MLTAPLLLAALLAAPPSDAVLAEGDGVRVTVAEYVARMREQSPAIRAGYVTIERKREFLDNLVRFKVLAAEARRLRLERDPEVLATLEKLMVQKLVQRSYSGAADVPPSDPALRGYYEAHRAEYQRPAKVRVSLRRFDAERQARAFLAAQAEARGARQGSEEGTEGDGEADAERSAEPAVPQLTDEGYLSHEELAARHGAAVAKAAFACAIGELAPVVVSERGAFVLRVDARQEALDRTFEQVREQLAAKLSREAKTKEFDAMIARLKSEARVRVDDALMERIVVE